MATQRARKFSRHRVTVTPSSLESKSSPLPPPENSENSTASWGAAPPAGSACSARTRPPGIPPRMGAPNGARVFQENAAAPTSQHDPSPLDRRSSSGTAHAMARRRASAIFDGVSLGRVARSTRRQGDARGAGGRAAKVRGVRHRASGKLPYRMTSGLQARTTSAPKAPLTQNAERPRGSAPRAGKGARLTAPIGGASPGFAAPRLQPACGALMGGRSPSPPTALASATPGPRRPGKGARTRASRRGKDRREPGETPRPRRFLNPRLPL
jgi:hypothetical protein